MTHDSPDVSLCSPLCGALIRHAELNGLIPVDIGRDSRTGSRSDIGFKFHRTKSRFGNVIYSSTVTELPFTVNRFIVQQTCLGQCYFFSFLFFNRRNPFTTFFPGSMFMSPT